MEVSCSPVLVSALMPWGRGNEEGLRGTRCSSKLRTRRNAKSDLLVFVVFACMTGGPQGQCVTPPDVA